MSITCGTAVGAVSPLTTASTKDRRAGSSSASCGYTWIFTQILVLFRLTIFRYLGGSSGSPFRSFSFCAMCVSNFSWPLAP